MVGLHDLNKQNTPAPVSRAMSENPQSVSTESGPPSVFSILPPAPPVPRHLSSLHGELIDQSTSRNSITAAASSSVAATSASAASASPSASAISAIYTPASVAFSLSTPQLRVRAPLEQGPPLQDLPQQGPPQQGPPSKDPPPTKKRGATYRKSGMAHKDEAPTHRNDEIGEKINQRGENSSTKDEFSNKSGEPSTRMDGNNPAEPSLAASAGAPRRAVIFGREKGSVGGTGRPRAVSMADVRGRKAGAWGRRAVKQSSSTLDESDNV